MYGCIHAPGIAASGIPRHFSPQVEAIDPATVVMDLSGMQRLLGSPSEIAGAIAKQAGPSARIALASNRAAAVHAARGLPGVTVIPAGDEAARLAALPVSLLETTGEIRTILAGWGIGTFGQLAALPETGIAERLGPEGVRIHKLARGVPGIPLQPDFEAPSFAERMELEHPVDLLEPLSFLLSRQLHALCDKLASYGLSALEIHLELTLTPYEGKAQPPHHRTIRLPVPMRNPLTFLKLLQLDLDAHPPPAPILAVAMRIEPAKPRAVQDGLFLPPSPEPEKLELTLQRIAALVGKENVGSPALVDTHRPGAFTVRPALEASGRVLSIPPATLAFRAFRPPVQARVVAAGAAPKQVWARAKSRVIEGRVLTAAGPWRTSGDWWTTAPWARDDWDLSLSDGALYRLYREYFTGTWFVDGEYD
jgi:protein ImuB